MKFRFSSDTNYGLFLDFLQRLDCPSTGDPARLTVEVGGPADDRVEDMAVELGAA